MSTTITVTEQATRRNAAALARATNIDITSRRTSTGKDMDPAVAAYVGAIPPQHRGLFDRVHRLILGTCPDARVVLSYKMPTYQLGSRRLYVGVWRHGVSLYGWKQHGDGGFTARHPDLQTSTGTIRVRSDAAAEILDCEFRDLIRAVLSVD